jgi:hypothetical protein
MTDKKAGELNTLTEGLSKLQGLCNQIAGDLNNKTVTKRDAIQMDVLIIDTICNSNR